MAKLTIKLDTRKANKAGEFPIKLQLTHQRTTVNISTGVSIKEKYWNNTQDVTKTVKPSCPNARSLNAGIADIYFELSNRLRQMTNDGTAEGLTVVELKERLLHKDSQATVRQAGLIEHMRKYAENKSSSTKEMFLGTENKLKEYCNGKVIDFKDISFSFLTGFDEFMKSQGNSMNTRSIHMRNIRAVFNSAIDSGVCDMSLYPFRKFRIRSARKEKEFLPVEAMRRLIALELPEDEPALHRARDLFLLSFCLCGANPVDIFNMESARNGVVTFVRQKIAHKEPEPVHIRLQPEALEIVGRNAGGGGRLVDFSERYLSYRNFYDTLKKRVKRLGEMVGEPGMTLYWARYSWATYAAGLDVPESVIGKALGHTDVTLAGSRYISFDWRKVDAANRRVLDWVWGKGDGG